MSPLGVACGFSFPMNPLSVSCPPPTPRNQVPLRGARMRRLPPPSALPWKSAQSLLLQGDGP